MEVISQLNQDPGSRFIGFGALRELEIFPLKVLDGQEGDLMDMPG